jgi:hypothetical protein
LTAPKLFVGRERTVEGACEVVVEWWSGGVVEW